MKILIINGPNMNFLGIREKEIYGTGTYEELCSTIKQYALKKDIEVELFQSNHEGEIVDKIQEAYFKKVDGIVINAAAYSHTSIAILDALKSVSIPTVEVHMSNVDEREEFRKFSYIAYIAKKVIKGYGVNSYLKAIDYLLDL